MINQADKEQEKVNQKLAVKLKDKAIIIPAFILAGILLFYFFTHSQSVQQPPIASQGYCNRSKPYPMPAEFSRALSLINERTLQRNKFKFLRIHLGGNLFPFFSSFQQIT